VQQTPNPLAQDPDEVPPLFVHSELQNRVEINAQYGTAHF